MNSTKRIIIPDIGNKLILNINEKPVSSPSIEKLTTYYSFIHYLHILTEIFIKNYLN